MSEIIIAGEKGKTFKIDLEDQTQKRYELVRELTLSSQKREEICNKYGYSRKTGNEYLNAWKNGSCPRFNDFFAHLPQKLYIYSYINVANESLR